MLTMLTDFRRRDFRQRGVALVLTLGFLSLMTTLAVAFAIAMRVERLASANYSEIIRTEQLARTALHMAMEDIYNELHIVIREPGRVDFAANTIYVSNAYDYPLGTQIGLHNLEWTDYPIYVAGHVGTNQIRIRNASGNILNLKDVNQFPETYGIVKRMAYPPGYVYPPWSAMASFSTNSPIQSPPNYLIVDEALKYIPASLWPAVRQAEQEAHAHTNFWHPLTAIVNGKTTLIGAIGYVVVNCSGFLDANYVGGAPRGDGDCPSEIAIEYLSEIGANKNSFLDFRTNNLPFETLPKLSTWKDGWQPESLFSYSGFLENQWLQERLDVKGDKVDLSKDEGEPLLQKLQRMYQSIIRAFTELGLTPEGAEIAYLNLLDYVDEDSIPRDLERSVDSTPMINEIVFENSVTFSQSQGVETVEQYDEFGNVTSTFIISITKTNRYRFDNRIKTELFNPSEFDNVYNLLLTANFSTDTPLVPPTQPINSKVDISGYGFITETFTSQGEEIVLITKTFFSQEGEEIMTEGQTLPPKIEWNYSVAKAEVQYENQTNDYVENLSCVITSSIPENPSTRVSRMGKECIDPRQNGDAEDTSIWSEWSDDPARFSIDDVNKITQWYWSNHNPPDQNMDTIKVANKPLEETPEGLEGLYFLRCSPDLWTTISNSANIHGYFRLGGYPILRGFVNPNTHIREALASVFVFHNLEIVHPDPFTNVFLNSQYAETTADAINTNQVVDNLYVRGSQYKSLQEVRNAIITSSKVPDYIESHYEYFEDQEEHQYDEYGGITNTIIIKDVLVTVTNKVLLKPILIGKSEKLFNVRGNLFVIVIEAVAASGGNIPKNPVRKKAVAIVWRDPFRDNFYVRSLVFL